MEEIKVGEYVRLKSGKIRQIKQVEKIDLYKLGKLDGYETHIYFESDGFPIVLQQNEELELKHSPNIIDLIGEGDLIKIPEGIFEVIYDKSYEKLGILVPNKTCLSIKHSALQYIFSEYKNVKILTKEQFDSSKYIVGGE